MTSMNEILTRLSSRKERLRRSHEKKITSTKNILWSSKAQKIERLCWFDIFNTNAEQERFKLRCTGYFEKIQKPHNGGDREWRSARGSTDVRSRSRSVCHSANTRRNVSSSIAWKALFWTRVFIWVENDETPRLSKNENIIICTMDFVILVVSGLSSSSSSSSTSTLRVKSQSSSSGESEKSSVPVTTRCDK